MKGRRQRKSIRLEGYAYDSPGGYFVTICSARRDMVFGRVLDEEVLLSEIGEMADVCLREIPQHFPTVEVGSHIVMPNHVHAILLLNMDECRGVPWNAPTAGSGVPGSLHSRISPRRGTLGLVVRNYKAAVTAWAHKDGFIGPVWQRGYHERVIRDDEEMHRLAKYVEENPIGWALDGENPLRNSP